jgi:nucleotide-binding universal stress UspA family protein
MRVLLGVDGSLGSNHAARLVGTLDWPPETEVHLVSVVDPGAWIPPGPGVPGGAGLTDERDVAAYYESQQLSISSALIGLDLGAVATVVSGRPATVIVDEARRIDADVVVVGSRGHGRIAALLLGSVSAALVDTAPCPVLVVRRDSMRRAVLALDGSSSARSAAQVVAMWPAFATVPITVVSIAETARPWTSGISPAFVAKAREAYRQDVRDALSEAREIADEAVAGLKDAGRNASADVRHGQAAAEIIAVADEADADLVVLGCRGRSSLGSVLLGSVARDVVLASSASVLTVRGPTGDAGT